MTESSNNANGTATGSLDPNQPTNNAPEAVISSGGRETQATTAFTADAEVKVATVNNPSWFKKLFSKNNDTYTQDIKSFLAKPVQLSSGSLTTSDGVSSFPQFALPNQAINTFPIWSQKLKGFLGLRCDIVLRFQVNANRFQQGRYMLCWTPSGGTPYSNQRHILHYSLHNATLVQRTQLHHVELDLNTQTEVILRIPYNSAFNYLDIDPMISDPLTCGCLGVVQLYPYSTLVAPSGSTSCTYTIWISLENVELIGATIPQMGTEDEQKKKGVGPLESNLVKVQKVSSIWADVPLVGAFASQVGWVSNLLAHSAHVFGWSRPANLEHAAFFQRQGLHQFGSCDVVDNSQVISYMSSNAVDVSPGFSGTETDEMDFAFIASVPAYQGQFDWTTSQAQATTLFSTLCSPNTNVTTTNGSGVNLVNNFAPVGFLSQFFSMWRGTLIYKLKFVKTEFHSGRIAVSFWPSTQYVTQNPANYTLVNTNYLHREIIDVREGNEFIFRVPYVSSTPYKYTNQTYFGSTTATDAANSTSGILAIHVLDSLVAPSSVSSTVSILIEVCGGPDIEFAQPRNISVTPFALATPQMNTGSNPELLYEGHIGASGYQEDRVVNAVVCIGERLRSFRQLLRIPIPNSLIGATGWAGAKYFNILPFSIPLYQKGTTVDATPNNNPDFYAILGTMYLYSRGGVRYKFHCGTASAATYWNASVNSQRSPITQIIQITTAATPTNYADTMMSRNYCPNMFSQVGQNNAAEFMVPQYNPTHSRVNLDYFADNATQFYPSGSKSMKCTNVLSVNMTNTTDSINTNIFRAGADDSNFGCFISVPPMTVMQSTEPAA